MNALDENGVRASLTVEQFLQEGGRDLEMELIAGGAGRRRKISETAINRPGLALTGFFEYFAYRRIQVLGLAECTYLLHLSAENRTARLAAFFSRKIPCVVVTRHQTITPEVRDLAEQRGVPLLRSRMITKHFVNAATIVVENLTAPRARLQGTMLEIQGIGVLIEGKPGLGKSEAALALIRRGNELVSDDITAVRLDSAGAVIASAVDVTRYHMEIRGVGIIHVPSLFGVASVRGEKRLELIVTLCLPGECDDTGDKLYARSKRKVLGVDIPRLTIPVAPGREIANVVETAALDFKLRLLGHDAEKELDESLIARMAKGKNVSE